MLKTNRGSTPLICAANSLCGSDEDIKKVAEFFLDKGAAMDARQDDGNKVLHYACSRGNLEMARLLLSY